MNAPLIVVAKKPEPGSTKTRLCPPFTPEAAADILNSDGPTLPLAYLEAAFAELDHADVTLGMGHDGGYYLIGLKRYYPQLFENITWSTARVIPQS